MTKIEAKGLERSKKRKKAVVVVEKQRLLMRAVVIGEEEESGLSSRRSFGSRVRVCSLPPPSSSLKAESCLKRDVNRERSSLESMFCYNKPIPEEIIEEHVGLSMSEQEIGDNKRCICCEAKGALLCDTCSGTGLYGDSIIWRAKASLLWKCPTSKTCFYTGSSKAQDLLSLPCETIGWRLEKFFGNSLERNGKGQRQDVIDPVTAFGTGMSELSELSEDFQGYFGRLVYGQMYHGYNLPGIIQQSYRTNEFYLRGLNGSTSTQPLPLHSLINGCQNMGTRRATGTYIPDMSQQLYHARFKDLGTRNSSSHQIEAFTKAIDDDEANSRSNLSGEVSTSCASIKEEECVKSETCSIPLNEIFQSPPENLGETISSSTLEMENGKAQESKTSKTLKGS